MIRNNASQGFSSKLEYLQNNIDYLRQQIMKEFDGGKLASMVQIIMNMMASDKLNHLKTGETGETGTFGNFMDPNNNTVALGSKTSLVGKNISHFDSKTLTGRNRNYHRQRF